MYLLIIAHSQGTVYFEMEKKIIKLECQIEKLKVIIYLILLIK